MQLAVAVAINMQGVDAPQVNRDSGGGIDDELSGRGPDGGANGAALQRQALYAGAAGQQAQARTGFDGDLTGRLVVDAGPGDRVGFKHLADGKLSRARGGGDG